jgi:hypothetical protein
MESEFQSELIKDLRKMFQGCIILKNDPNYLQGFPDLIILYEDRWAVLEVKESSRSRHRPNQDYYIDLTYSMSYGSFIYPQNKEQVLHELQQAFRSR